MKKELTLGTPFVPARDINVVSKRFRELLNRVLPEECQCKTSADCWYVGCIVSGVLTTSADCWYVGCIVSGVLTMMLPFCLPLLGYCLYRAKKAEKGGGR